MIEILPESKGNILAVDVFEDDDESVRSGLEDEWRENQLDLKERKDE